MTEPHVFPARTCPRCGCSLRRWPPESNKWECLICDVEVYHEGEETTEPGTIMPGITTEQALEGLRVLASRWTFRTTPHHIGLEVEGAEGSTLWLECEVDVSQLPEQKAPSPPSWTEVSLSTFKRWCAWAIVVMVVFLVAFYTVTLIQAARF